MEKISIVIPTYNRKKTLPRTLYSLDKQTVRDFICIIIDDGSTDKTGELVDHMKRQLSFSIDYYYQENKGVLSARLLGIEKANTELIMLLDSDDEIIENAIEIVLKTWYGLSKSDRAKYYGIITPCKDYESNKILGRKYLENINNCSYRQYFNARLKADQFSIYRRNILYRQYQEYEIIKKEANSNFVPESILQLKYEMKYRLYGINDPLLINHREDADSLCRSPLTKDKCLMMYFSYCYILKKYFPNKKLSFFMQMHYSLYMVKFALLLRYTLPKIYKDVGSVRNKLILTLALPFGIGNYLLGQKIKGKNN